MQPIFSLLSAILGTIGFSLLFHVRPRRLPFMILGGGLTWGVYLLVEFSGIFTANLFASLVMTLYCEIVARWKKMPVISVLTPTIVVLVPGGFLYHSFFHVLSREFELAFSYAFKTLDCCLGISAGIFIASFLVKAILSAVRRIKEKNQKRI